MYFETCDHDNWGEPGESHIGVSGICMVNCTHNIVHTCVAVHVHINTSISKIQQEIVKFTYFTIQVCISHGNATMQCANKEYSAQKRERESMH